MLAHMRGLRLDVRASRRAGRPITRACECGAARCDAVCGAVLGKR
jgi:hypothetical protein